MSESNQKKRMTELMTEVLSEVETIVPNYWVDDEDNQIWVIMNVILTTVIMESWIVSFR